MKKTLQFAALFLALALAAAGPSFPRQQKKKADDIRVDVTVSAITIAVTVQTGGGKYINDLTDKDFTIYENNEKRPITYFKHDSTRR